MMLSRTIMNILLVLIFATFSITTFAQNSQPIGPTGNSQNRTQSEAERRIQEIKSRVMPTDSTDQDKNVRADGYAPLYIVTRVQNFTLPGYVRTSVLDRNGTKIPVSNFNGFQACASGEQTNDTSVRVQLGTEHAWYTRIQHGGCTSPAVCGACVSWSDEFNATCNPGECGDGAWHNRVPGAGLETLYRGYKVCGADVRLDSYWSYAQEVPKSTPLSANVRDIVVRRTCYTTEWAKTTPDR